MKESKINQILDYLERGGIVTDVKAVEICNNYRLSATIYELRHNRGLNIQDRWVQNKDTGTRYKEYWLVQE